MHRTLCALALVGACGPSSGQPVDAAPTVDGPCGNDVFFTGDYLDWDATTTKFCGIFQATWQLQGEPSRKYVTNPNGRFELCVPAGARVEITPPTGASVCATGTYATKGLAIADATAINRGTIFSSRSFTGARRDALFTAIGQPYSAAKAHVFVHVTTAAAISTTAPHDAAQAFDGATWAASSTGTDVFFPNVTVPGSGMVSITVAGGRTVDVPVVADTITYASP